MLALAAAMVVVLGAEEGRGEGPQPVKVELREATRFRGGVAIAGAASFSDFGFVLGPGVSGELGLQLSDRVGLLSRATVGTLIIYLTFSAGLALDYAFSDHFSASVGLGMGLNGGVYASPPVVKADVPVRLHYSFAERRPDRVPRSSVYVFFELAPGAVLSDVTFPGGPSRLVLSTALGVGYLAW